MYGAYYGNPIQKALRKYLEDYEVSKTLLAKKMGTCCSLISRIENGEGLCNAVILSRLIDSCGINAVELLKELSEYDKRRKKQLMF